MGASASIPNDGFIDKETARRLASEQFDPSAFDLFWGNQFDQMATDGKITRADFDSFAAKLIAFSSKSSTPALRPAPVTFEERLSVANEVIGAENLLDPEQARAFLKESSDALFLDVQDEGGETVEGTYSCSLGTLYYKADNTCELRDPTIADRDRNAPILITCGVGGQARIGAHIMIDYGFSNVKVLDGGCQAWIKAAKRLGISANEATAESLKS